MPHYTIDMVGAAWVVAMSPALYCEGFYTIRIQPSTFKKVE